MIIQSVVLLAFGMLALPTMAEAGDLKTPFALEMTETLPKGVRNPRFINVITSVDTRFTDSGGTESLGNALNKFVTWQDMLREVEAREGRDKRVLVEGLIDKNSEDLGEGPGSTSGEVNTFANVKVAALAYGITDRLTIAGVLPIVKVDVSASTAYVANNNTTRFLKEVSSAQSPLVAQETAAKFNDSINRKLTRLGYEPIPASQTISGVGDFQLVTKYRAYDDGVNSIAVRNALIFPTGIAPNPDKALDVPTGDGRYGVALSGIYDRKLPMDFRFNSYLTYTAFLPNNVERRIPTSVFDRLSADKEVVHENLRSQFLMSSGLEHKFSKIGVIVGGGYTFQYMTRAEYDPGTLLIGNDAGRYSLLSDVQPLQSMHSMVLSAGFSTVDWFREKKFVYPFQFNLAYTHPLAGRNVSTNDLVVGELVLFF